MEDVKKEISKTTAFFMVEKIWVNRKISLQTKIRMLETTVKTADKYGSEIFAL